MIKQAIISKWKFLIAAVVLLALMVTLIAVVVAVVMVYRADEVMMVPAPFAMGDYHSLAQELTAFVPIPKDSNLPSPTL